MAEHSNAIWMLALIISFAGTISKDTSLDISLNDAEFNCKMGINNKFWKLNCTSENAEIGLLSEKFFYLKLHGIFKATSPIAFHDLLSSTSLSESEFFICDNIWRYIISAGESSVIEFCENISTHTSQSIQVLNESFVTSVNITHIPHLEMLMTIFNESSHLEKVSIYDCYLPNLTNFPVHLNNSVNTLILQQNKIENIDGDILSKVPNLSLLDLSKNNLKNINQSVLSNITMISTLDLSYNFIEYVTNNAFSNMISLKNLYLQSNMLKSISEAIFLSSNLLQVLDISNNDLRHLPPTLFHTLSELTNVSCSNCSLTELNQFLFINSTKIQYIIFSHNHIQFIPEDLFRYLSYLYYVDLGYNQIKEFNTNMFPFHPYLHFLILKHNEIKSLKNGIFDGISHLYYLDMSDNKIDTLIDENVKLFTNLEHLDLRRNKIEVVELGLVKELRLRNIYLSNNFISNLKVKWKNLIYLEKFHIDNNQLTSLDLPPCIQSIKQTITFSFKYNNITRITLDSLLEDEIKVKGDKRSMAGCFFNGEAKNFVDITHNPLICDCYLFPLYTYIKWFPKKNKPESFHDEGNKLEKFLHKGNRLESFVDEDNITCFDPVFKISKRVKYLKDDAFNCPFTTECPFPCICGIRGKDKATFVNCSGSNLKNVPQEKPEGTTVLYFNKNSLHSMKSLNSEVWNSLKEAHLDSNFLTDNLLNDWNYPESLRYVSVRGNNLTTIPNSLKQFILNQTSFQLYFGDNDKNCTCDRKDLKTFITENSRFIGDEINITCEVISNGKKTFLPLISLPDSELCPIVGLNNIQKRLVVSLCIFFLILILALVIYYRQRQIILSFFYIHCDQLYRLFYSEEEYDEDKIFDAFVAYSSSDRDIVMDILQELENHPPYFKLCIHERNWVPGRFICDNILSSVQSSKRTIIVLSNSFINSPWFNLELRAAVSKMSEEKISRIIIILAEKGVTLSDIDPELRHVVSKRTYLVWKEGWFWEKLRYAMPRIKYTKNNETVMQRTERSNSTSTLIPEQA